METSRGMTPSERLPDGWESMVRDHLSGTRAVVVEGGGVRGLAYPAAWQELEPLLPLDDIDHYVGTSAGAITALGLVLGQSASRLRTLTRATPWRSFLRLSLRAPWSRRAGVHSIRPAQQWIRGLIRDAGLREEVTLRQLRYAMGSDLVVCAWEESSEPTRLAVLDPDTAPDMPAYVAVSASMAIPGFFEPVVWDGRQYVDGGVGANFPYREAITRASGGAVLGLRIDRSDELYDARSTRPPRGLARRLMRISSGLRAHVHGHVPEDVWRQTVRIVEDTVGTTDFDLDEAAIRRLEHAGRSAAHESIVQWYIEAIEGEHQAERESAAASALDTLETMITAPDGWDDGQRADALEELAELLGLPGRWDMP